MFDFSGANDHQKKAISTVEGPLLITAGPGTGKTFTLVQRVNFLILEKQVKPENIMVATFTEKAARELVSRISSELIKRKIKTNINDMYIGTFHSICLRLLKENMEFTRLKKNFRTMDDFDQHYKLFGEMNRLKNIEGFAQVVFAKGHWQASDVISKYINIIAEEQVDVEAMLRCQDGRIVTLGKIKQKYDQLLKEENLLDFSSIQTEAFNLLSGNDAVLENIREKIKYIMVDEYQDTNYIQEQLIFLIGLPLKNICVVGDDDQGLYRFRGATIRNILEFPEKFPEGECARVNLQINYRSNPDILSFFNEWMSDDKAKEEGFNWDRFRYRKSIIPNKKKEAVRPAVIRIGASGDEWMEEVLKFCQMLVKKNKIADYNQLAFLFSSVRAEKAQNLANHLESHGIKVYSPRSAMFFQREEIKLIIGCMLKMFPFYRAEIDNGEVKYLGPQDIQYYESCIEYTESLIKGKAYKSIRGYLDTRASAHTNMQKNADYSLAGLVYELISFSPFKEYIGTDLTSGLIDQRPVRNLALFSQIIGKYEMLHGIDVLTPKNIERSVRELFSLYLKLLLGGGLSEYEDDTEYAPSGCVSFLTIHQAKGMEFPIVFVDSLSNYPRKENDELIEVMQKYKLFKREAFEPADQIKYFDFWRKYYTAFSRAQDLLVLCAEEKSKEPSKQFRNIYNALPRNNSKEFDIESFDFCSTRTVNLTDRYSFTSNISVYENCPRQYKFYKELSFAPVREGSAIFGMLVHQTIEDIHKAAIKGNFEDINDDSISRWLSTNYSSISRTEHAYLGEAQIKSAYNQVKKYADSQKGKWERIQEAEVQIGLARDGYILEGVVDLIRGEKDTVEIVDFKSEKKPEKAEYAKRIEHIKRQLQVYAHLIEEKQQKKVSKMHIYFTSEEAGSALMSFINEKGEIDKTLKEFDTVVKKIQKKEFKEESASSKVCSNCDFRYYCRKIELKI